VRHLVSWPHAVWRMTQAQRTEPHSPYFPERRGSVRRILLDPHHSCKPANGLGLVGGVVRLVDSHWKRAGDHGRRSAVAPSSLRPMACIRMLPIAVASTGPAWTGRPQGSAVKWQSKLFLVTPRT